MHLFILGHGDGDRIKFLSLFYYIIYINDALHLFGDLTLIGFSIRSSDNLVAIDFQITTSIGYSVVFYTTTNPTYHIEFVYIDHDNPGNTHQCWVI